MKNKTNVKNISAPRGISDRIMRIQQGLENTSTLIHEYIPFINATIFKVTGKHITKESDETSIGLMAFDEAIRAYNPTKGTFLTFASWVIRRRIIDYMRTQSRNKEINFSNLNHVELSLVNNSPAPDDCWVENPLKLEIDALSKRLKKYNIGFDDLVTVSPKAQKTKKMCADVIEYIINNPSVFLQLRQKKRLPVKILQNNLKIPLKFLDHHRKYIVAVVEILSGDYVYLKEDVAFIGKGGRI